MISQIAQHLRFRSPPFPPLANDPPSAQPPDSTAGGSSSLTPLSWEEAVKLLDTIPGVARRTAELLLAEIGLDMSRFPTAAPEGEVGATLSGQLRKWGETPFWHYWSRQSVVT